MSTSFLNALLLIALVAAGSGDHTDAAETTSSATCPPAGMPSPDGACSSQCCVCGPAVEALTSVVNVACYGANGADLADDTLAIEAALEAALTSSLAPNRRLHFPSGRYRVDLGCESPRFLLSGDIVVEGNGPELTTIQADTDCTSTLFGISSGESATVKNISLIGPGMSTLPPGDPSCLSAPIVRAVWHLQTANDVPGRMVIENVTTSGFWEPLKSDGNGATVIISESNVSALKEGFFAGSGARVHVRNTTFHHIGITAASDLRCDQGHALYVVAPLEQLLVEGSTFEKISGFGVHRFGCPDTGCGKTSGDVVVTGNRFVSVASGGVELDGGVAYRAVISGNSFENDFGTVFQQGVGVHVQADDVLVTGNTFKVSNVGVTGLAPAARGNVSSNLFTLSGGTAIGVQLLDANTGWNISGNRFSIASGSSEGVRLDGAIDTNIVGNTFSAPDGAIGTGVLARNGTDSVQLASNLFIFRGDNNAVGISIAATAADPITAQAVGNLFSIVPPAHGILSEVDGLVSDHNLGL